MEKTRPRLQVDRPSESAEPGGHPMELWISYVLRAGVMTAGIIIFVGVILFLVLGPPAGGPHRLNDIIGNGGQSISVSPRSIGHQIAAGSSIAVIQLGVLVLILTPLMRVGMTVFLFFAQRDRVFVAITSVVFIVLVLGLIGVGS